MGEVRTHSTHLQHGCKKRLCRRSKLFDPGGFPDDQWSWTRTQSALQMLQTRRERASITLLLRAGKNNKQNFNFRALKMARLGPLLTPKLPRKSLCGSLFCVFSQEMRHINFFLGAQYGAFWVGAKKFMLKKFMCFVRPLVAVRDLAFFGKMVFRKKFSELQTHPNLHSPV